MILINNIDELYNVREKVPTFVYDFLCQQFSFLDDDDPQMNVYGNPEFLCTTGTIGIVYSQEELQGFTVLDEMMISDDVKLFLCQDENQFLDVVLVERHD